MKPIRPGRRAAAGFTIVELLVALAISLIISAIMNVYNRYVALVER